jgi:formylmethanofuran dehydrogenase subunit E
MTELIPRWKALALIEKELGEQRAAERSKNPIRKKEGRAAAEALQRVDNEIQKLEAEDQQIYDYAEFTDHYRLVPCDDDVRCHRCGYKRPRPRGEEVNFCSLCGCCFGLKEE